MANSDFFLRTLPLFDGGQDVGMVLSPQCFHNLRLHADVFNHANIHFWEYAQHGYDALGFISCTGTPLQCCRAAHGTHARALCGLRAAAALLDECSCARSALGGRSFTWPVRGPAASRPQTPMPVRRMRGVWFEQGMARGPAATPRQGSRWRA